jgi:nicotinate-nucleotide adenylyltransferase
MIQFPAAPGLRIGLLGGSFNPAHRGHVAISLVALKLLALDRVVWLVSPRNPLKPAATLADFEERMERAHAAVAGQPRIIVSRFEEAAGLHYTIDTLALLKRMHARTRFVFLIGADNLVGLSRWKDWVGVVNAVPIAVFSRPGWDLRAPASKAAQRFARRRLPVAEAPRLASCPPPAWIYLPFTHDETSATAIRRTGRWPPSNPVAATPHKM